MYDQLVLLALMLVATILISFRLLGRQRPSPAERVDGTRPAKGPKTFRITRVPSSWDEQRLQLFLTDQGNFIRPVVESLAIDIDGRWSTGTATFENVPSQLQNGPHWKVPLARLSETQPAQDEYLIIDHAFLGITPVYSPHPENHKIE